ncbi:hypothetical protein BH18ACI2_BH18ACI2_10190 [soil metagenome]
MELMQGECDPFRVGSVTLLDPAALPPAIEFMPFGHEDMRT